MFINEFKNILIIIGIVIFVAFWAFAIYELKNAQEVDPNDETFLK